MKLAIHGGTPEVTAPMARYDSVGNEGMSSAEEACWSDRPLSGYLGGIDRGGYYVSKLEDEWAAKFGAKHAIACNSATSGLMAAAFAVGLGKGDRFAVSPYTMSATVAAPMFTGAEPVFCDVEVDTFCLDPDLWSNHRAISECRAVVITNLFGHPSRAMDMAPNLSAKCALIEDNSQSPLAMDHDYYAGTFGDVGVFSLNVHKHLNCGEGGICVTDDAGIAKRLRQFINHGEMDSGTIGLNLRMTEISAAIALDQLRRADELIDGRVNQASEIVQAIGDIPGLMEPYTRELCRHVFYAIPYLLLDQEKYTRFQFVEALRAEGVPLAEGYVQPLYHLPAFAKYKRDCSVAEDLYSNQLFYFENCAYSPTPEQVKQIGNAFQKVAEELSV